MYYYEKTVALSKKLKYDIAIGSAHNSLGRTYYLLGKMDNAITESKKTMSSIHKVNSQAKSIIADPHIALASTCSRKNAITHLLETGFMHQKSSLRPDIIAAAYQNLSTLYLELEEYPSAIAQF